MDEGNLLKSISDEFFRAKPTIEFGSLAIEYGLDRDIEAVLDKSWDELELEDFNSSSHLLYSLPECAVAYYLGALIYISTKTRNFESLALDSILPVGVNRSRKKRSDPALILLNSTLSASQLSVFCEFLELAGQVGPESIAARANLLSNAFKDHRDPI